MPVGEVILQFFLTKLCPFFDLEFSKCSYSGALAPACGALVYLYLSMKIRLDFSCESSAKQRIHLKHQVLFFLKNNEIICMNVVCCSRDWRFKG